MRPVCGSRDPLPGGNAMNENMKATISTASVRITWRRGHGVVVPGNLIVTAAHVGWATAGRDHKPGHYNAEETSVTSQGRKLGAAVYTIEPVADIAVLGEVDGQCSQGDHAMSVAGLSRHARATSEANGIAFVKIVIQCAGRKNAAKNTFLAPNGRRVVFVARPDLAPRERGTTHAHPDDAAANGRSWRQELVAYNSAAKANPLGLLPAYQLYAHDAYRNLVDKFGVEQVFILSAGWGIIPADVPDAVLRHHLQRLGRTMETPPHG